MPIYEYQCQICEHALEALHRVSDAPLTECPECGEPALRKLVSAPRFRLKGSGWYETDFKTGEKKNLAGDKEAKETEVQDGKGSADGKDTKAGKDTKDSKPGQDQKKAVAKPAGGDSPKAGKSGSGDGGKTT